MSLLPTRFLSLEFSTPATASMTVVDAVPLPPTAGSGYQIAASEEFEALDDSRLTAVFQTWWDFHTGQAVLITTAADYRQLALQRLRNHRPFLLDGNRRRRLLLWESGTIVFEGQPTTLQEATETLNIAGPPAPADGVTRCKTAILLAAAQAESLQPPARNAFENTRRKLEKAKKTPCSRKNTLPTNQDYGSLSIRPRT